MRMTGLCVAWLGTTVTETVHYWQIGNPVQWASNPSPIPADALALGLIHAHETAVSRFRGLGRQAIAG
jgi:hypothetical protein